MHLIIGKDKNANEITHNLEKLPVILMAGQTGSGKSNLTHYFICSLLEQFSPEELKLVLVDCKQVEFNYFYKDSPYLLSPIIYCYKENVPTFNELMREIDSRKNSKNKKPFIFIAIDEFSDLMYFCPDKMEKLVESVAKDGSEIGMGLVLYTSRPGRDVITEKIDQAVQTRIGLETASDNDSEVIIHQKGCTELKGSGDGLYLRYIDSKPIHFQVPLITKEAIRKAVKSI